MPNKSTIQSNSLRTAYSGQENLIQAEDERNKAQERLLNLIDARQKYVQQGYDEAEAYKSQMQSDAANSAPTSGAMAGAASGSKYGPYGAVIGGAVGAIGGHAKHAQHIDKRAKEEGKSTGWKRWQKAKKFMPWEVIKDLGMSFVNNPKASTSAVGAIKLNTENYRDKVNTSRTAPNLEAQLRADPDLAGVYNRSQSPEMELLDKQLYNPSEGLKYKKPMKLEGVPRVLKAAGQ